MKPRLLAGMIVFFLLLIPLSRSVLHANLDPPPWPMFRHDAMHTGLSEYAGPSMSKLKWSYETGMLFSSPALGSDGSAYIGSYDNNIYALNSNGILNWSYLTGNPVFSSPALGGDGRVYVGSCDNNFYVFNSDGVRKWSYSIDNDVNTTLWAYSSPALGSDDSAYIGSFDNNLYMLNSDGALSWSYLTVDDVDSSPALGRDGSVYVGSDDNMLYALNSDGVLSWSYRTVGDANPSAAIGSDGKVYIGSYDNALYALSSNGMLDWSYLTEHWAYSSPALEGDAGIYVGVSDNVLLYYVEEGIVSQPSPTITPTPCKTPLAISTAITDATIDTCQSIKEGGWTIDFCDGLPPQNCFGYIKDKENVWRACDVACANNTQLLYVRVGSVEQSLNWPDGYSITITYDGGKTKRICFPEIVNGIMFQGYVEEDGTTCSDHRLCEACYTLPTSTPTPTITPTWDTRTPTYTPTESPTQTPTTTPTTTNTPTITPTPTITITPSTSPTGTPAVTPTDPPVPSVTMTPTRTPTIMPMPTETAIPTLTPVPPLVIEPGMLTAGQPFTLAIRLNESITRPFDFYLIAETPAGIYTIYLNGNIKKRIIALYRNVRIFNAPYSTTVYPKARVPASMGGISVTFYAAVVEAGKKPPIRRLSDLTPSTQYVIMMDMKPATVAP